jgi:hypothetical protein
MSHHAALYDTDFFLWTQRQASVLRAVTAEGLDGANLAEEIESLGRQERQGLASHLAALLRGLLQWQYPGAGEKQLSGQSWRAMIVDHRESIRHRGGRSPSLVSLLPQMLPEAYAQARVDAGEETGVTLETFPDHCPWSVEQVIDDNFWPEG